MGGRQRAAHFLWPPRRSAGNKLYQCYTPDIVSHRPMVRLGRALRSSEMRSFVRRLLCDRRAVTAVEYSLIVCLIATAAISAMTTLGHRVLNMLGPATNSMP